jgi:antibiotic biosynthesis monooxygenase (ABM) superfamily enzyme
VRVLVEEAARNLSPRCPASLRFSIIVNCSTFRPVFGFSWCSSEFAGIIGKSNELLLGTILQVLLLASESAMVHLTT